MGVVTIDRDNIINHSVTERMRDQRQITIRAIRPDDKELIMKGLPRLGAGSMYRRFFTAKSGFTNDEWKTLTEVDFVNVVALVAVLQAHGEDWVIAGGRYMRSGVFGNRQRAEVAFMIGDPIQGQGIGTILFNHLVAIARASGIAEFEAEVLPSNTAMLKVFEKGGHPVKTSAARESVHVIIDLAGCEASP
jgi:RimJ/RimL family protein N-acetyltransferase